MAGVSPWHINVALQKPKPLQNPWNTNIPGSGLAVNNGAGVPAIAPPAPPAAPPPPVDYNALINADPAYTTGLSDLQRQNQLSMDQLLKNFRGTAQSYQDQANAHGALFSGAAVNAQRSAAQGYSDAASQQAQNLQSGQHNLYNNVWNRLLQQLAGGA